MLFIFRHQIVAIKLGSSDSRGNVEHFKMIGRMVGEHRERLAKDENIWGISQIWHLPMSTNCRQPDEIPLIAA